MAPAERGGFRRVGERLRYDAHFFRVVTGTFVDPLGFTFEREMIRHPGAVCVVPLEDDGRHILCVRQYRAAIDVEVLELPAGKRDVPGEDPEVCARRELVEEVGREAASWTELGRFYNSVGFSDEQTFCFLAEGLTTTEREAHGVEEQHMTIERIELDASRRWSPPGRSSTPRRSSAACSPSGCSPSVPAERRAGAAVRGRLARQRAASVRREPRPATPTSVRW